MRYDTYTDGSLVFQICTSVKDETRRSNILNNIARIIKAIEETNICIKSVNIEDDEENSMLLAQMNIQTRDAPLG